jgi:hypothetical protein
MSTSKLRNKNLKIVKGRITPASAIEKKNEKSLSNRFEKLKATMTKKKEEFLSCLPLKSKKKKNKSPILDSLDEKSSDRLNECNCNFDAYTENNHVPNRTPHFEDYFNDNCPVCTRNAIELDVNNNLKSNRFTSPSFLSNRTVSFKSLETTAKQQKTSGILRTGSISLRNGSIRTNNSRFSFKKVQFSFGGQQLNQEKTNNYNTNNLEVYNEHTKSFASLNSFSSSIFSDQKVTFAYLFGDINLFAENPNDDSDSDFDLDSFDEQSITIDLNDFIDEICSYKITRL